ncbi:MAG: GNAT family N-acetyltransferase [Aphanothece sp. CMT-3BRIN-NPC111]|jgi:ribosomal-protein-alanine N-acetyltransferase|nr:GNAT family N-acetyltransferase [Aphanothece sp. CMT-3BRIN-NPC111]
MNRPWPHLCGERVILRLATEKNVPQIIAFYRDNAAHLETISSPKPNSFYTTEFWTQKVRSSHEDFQIDRSCNFFIFDIADDCMLLGFTNFFSFIRGAFHACILGYGLAQSAQGKGLMTESLRLAIDFAFNELNLHRIMANHSPTNVRSGRLLRRLNFLPEGYARDYLLVHNEWQDQVLNALTNPNWKPPQT